MARRLGATIFENATGGFHPCRITRFAGTKDFFGFANYEEGSDFVDFLCGEGVSAIARTVNTAIV